MARRKRRSVRQQYLVRAPPKKVFRSLTDPDRMTRWFADRAEISPRKGGRFLLAWEDGPTHTGKLLEFVRGESITYGWTWPDLEELGVTKFKISVEPKGKGTLVKVVHSGFPTGARWDDLYAGAVWGWTYFMMNLKSVVEHGHDLRSRHDG